MVAFPENPDGKEEGHPAGTKPQGEKLGKEIMVKGPLERLMVEERAMYPEKHPTKAKRVLHPRPLSPP